MNARAKAVTALAAVWLVAGAVVFAARATKPTPRAVLAFLREADASPGFVAALAGRMNRLTFDEREKVKRSEEYIRTYQQLPPAGKAQYLTATVPTDLRQTLDAIARMPREKRQGFMDAVAGQAESNNINLAEDAAAKERIKRIAEDELRDYFTKASPGVRDELAPVLDQAHKVLRIW